MFEKITILLLIIFFIYSGVNGGSNKESNINQYNNELQYYFFDDSNNFFGIDSINEKGNNITFRNPVDNDYKEYINEEENNKNFGSIIKYNNKTGEYEYSEGIITGKENYNKENGIYIDNTTLKNKTKEIYNNINNNTNYITGKMLLSNIIINQKLLEKGKTKYYPFHVGVDYKIKYKDIYAWKDNIKVIKFGYDYYIGNYIILNEGKNKILLSHLDSINKSINEGEILKLGTLLGKTGNSGNNTTGAHLHIEFYHDGIIQGDNVINNEMNCILLGNKCDYKIVNSNYNKDRFRQLLKNEGLYNDKYNNFFNKLEELSKKLNYPEKSLLALKISTGLSFGELEKSINQDFLNSNYLLSENYKRNYGSIVAFLNCINAKNIGMTNNCNNFSYGREQYNIMMNNLYNNKILFTVNKNLITNPDTEDVLNSTINFLKTVEGLHLEAYPDGYTGRYSIGFGTISYKGEKITYEEAFNRAKKYLKNALPDDLKPFNKNIQIALLSYRFNRGYFPKGRKDYLNKGDLNGLKKIMNNNGINEKFKKGLYNRRLKEYSLIDEIIKGG